MSAEFLNRGYWCWNAPFHHFGCGAAQRKGTRILSFFFHSNLAGDLFKLKNKWLLDRAQVLKMSPQSLITGSLETPQALILAQPLFCCVSLGKSVNLSGPDSSLCYSSFTNSVTDLKWEERSVASGLVCLSEPSCKTGRGILSFLPGRWRRLVSVRCFDDAKRYINKCLVLLTQKNLPRRNHAAPLPPQA
ncbi:hypothetical protein KIL84_018886 [Mauremys mutica]|uniref:Uncharacterized protein n=1 Tax=Mauremys mutica TaxID=74926 RepID=A0A9D3XUJ2_9SAUR|nr:hypothetical protein KIL84_018886 [Mauremys mutica]